MIHNYLDKLENIHPYKKTTFYMFIHENKFPTIKTSVKGAYTHNSFTIIYQCNKSTNGIGVESIMLCILRDKKFFSHLSIDDWSMCRQIKSQKCPWVINNDKFVQLWSQIQSMLNRTIIFTSYKSRIQKHLHEETNYQISKLAKLSW